MLIKEIAGITIKLLGSGSLLDELAEQLNFSKEDKKNIDIILEFGDISKNDYEPKVYSAKSFMHFNEKQFCVGYLHDFNYVVSNLFNETDEPTHIKISQKKPTLHKAFIKKLLGRKSSDSILSYGLFWYVYQIVILKKGMSFIHGASVVNKNKNKTLLIAGTGGCGKTSTILELISQEKAEYLSEDFSILDKLGRLFYNPKPVSIYFTDIDFGSKVLKSFRSEFGFFENIFTFLRRKVLKINPLFKVPPQKIFKCNSEGDKNLTALYFVRTEGGCIKAVDCTADEFANRSVEASIRELKTYTELASLVLSNDKIGTGFFDYGELRNKMLNVYLSAFDDKKIYIIYLPIGTDPKETVRFLEDNEFI